ncbi:MAG: 4'-phosphopantetheinyl transferase superfamily protein [Rhodospirillales bacterium]|nr:4'-phosphopantetheinyl transferase superfamily protein [Rhodospirillales bacterium]
MTHPPKPTGDAVHLWTFDVDALAVRVDEFASILSASERSRAQTFLDAVVRDRFIMRRGLLRRTLGGYLGRDPAWLVFNDGPDGKPALSGADDISFNLSASENALVIAIDDGREVGVDIERRRAINDMGGMAERFLSPFEAAYLDGLEPDIRTDAFWTVWTCNEAVVKALGLGLRAGLRNFTVDCSEIATPRVIGVPGMHLQAWRSDGGFQAALATPFVAAPVFMT